MEGNFSVEKGICFFLLVLNGIDYTVVWGISCFVAKELGISAVGMFSGLLGSAFCLGKLSGFKLVSLITEKVQIKWVLISLYFLSACASLSFGFISNFGLAIFCRFLNGVFANSQFAVRKLLKSIDYQAKESDSGTFQKALYAYKIGGCIGVFLGSFLTNCEDFMPKSSQFVEKKFLLVFLIIFLVNFSGVLLVFSIETKAFILVEVKNNYVELGENKENKEIKESEIENPENGTQEKSEFVNYIQSSVLGNGDGVSEDCAGPEEVKFYSPREGSAKDNNVRKLNSTKPKVEPSFSFPEVATEAKEQEKGEEKRTHISFIEEELEQIQEDANSEPKPPGKIEEVKNDRTVRTALSVRLLVTVSIALVYESFPVTVYLMFQERGKYEIGAVIFLAFSVGVGGYYLIVEKVMAKYSVAFQLTYFCGLMSVFLAIFPVLCYWLTEKWYFLIPFWVGWMFCIEGIMGIGNIIISDAVRYTEREVTLDKSNVYSILVKVIISCISSPIVWVLNYSQIGYLFFSLFFVVLFWVARRIPKCYPYLSEVPYKL